MALKVRLARFGAKKKPFYRVVIAQSESPRDGRFIEHVGYYDPKTDPITVKIDLVRIDHWLKMGAEPTETVKSLICRARTAVQNS